MDIERQASVFSDHLSMHLENLISPDLCAQLIARYDQFAEAECLGTVVNEIIDQCAEHLFIGNVHSLLSTIFQGAYKARWPRLDVVDSSAIDYEYNKLWHLDGGITGTLKLFVYLNPVSEHGGNTPIIDKDRTEILRCSDALPLCETQRSEDLTSQLTALGLDTGYKMYDLKAGGALLFSPLLLAHRCLPPRFDKKRYTVCFTLTPPF